MSKKNVFRTVKLPFVIATIVLFVGCGSINRYGVSQVDPMMSVTDANAEKNSKEHQENNKPIKKQRFNQTPSIGFKDIVHSINNGTEVEIKGEPVSLNVDSLPLPAFINEVFGNILNQSFQISPRLLEKKDLVTLRLSEEIARKDLFYTTKQLLETYGVAIMTEGEILRFVIARNGQTSEAPLFVTGETLPNVPSSHRPIFQVIPLKIVQNNNAINWLKAAFSGRSLKITQDPYRNAIWLQGKIDDVREAAQVLKILDQPLMRGRYSLQIEPLFLGADTLVDRLIDVLVAEGYDASKKKYGTINFIPIEETNSIVVFATDNAALEHVKEWVIELDKPLKQSKKDNLFFYSVKNTSAETITEVLNKVNSSSTLQRPNNTNTNKTPIMPAPTNLVVDTSRNAILYKGNAEQWAALLPIIKKMDIPDVQVLVEVIVAEVKLSENFSFGIEWAINNATLPGAEGITKNALTIGAGGLSYFPISNSGSTRAVLNALATDSNVKLLQKPKILVRSGQQASINVGDEVPIVTSQSTVSGQQIDGTSALTQSVQYRKTGNTLSIKPVVYSGGQVNLEISQEISSAQPTSSSGLDTPTILTRSLQTSLSVKDGGSVLIGGLIQTNDVESETRVPFLSDIPFIGKLFTQKSNNTSRTELMILVIPYVIRNQDDAQAITRAFRSQLQLHDETQ